MTPTEFDLAMVGFGNEVLRHPELQPHWDKPLMDAVIAVARYAGAPVDADEPACAALRRLTHALEGKRCRR